MREYFSKSNLCIGSGRWDAFFFLILVGTLPWAQFAIWCPMCACSCLQAKHTMIKHVVQSSGKLSWWKIPDLQDRENKVPSVLNLQSS